MIETDNIRIEICFLSIVKMRSTRRRNYTHRPVPNVSVRSFPRFRFEVLKRTEKRFSAQLSLITNKLRVTDNFFFVPTPAASRFSEIFEFAYSYHDCYICFFSQVRSAYCCKSQFIDAFSLQN